MNAPIPIRNSAELAESIEQLSLKQHQQMGLIKEELNAFLENLKPVNLVKQTLDDVIASNEIQSQVLDLSLGVISGMFVKKLMVQKSDNALLLFAGNMVEKAVSQKVIKERKWIHSVGNQIAQFLFPKK
jgi:hypothetical protein